MGIALRDRYYATGWSLSLVSHPPQTTDSGHRNLFISSSSVIMPLWFEQLWLRARVSHSDMYRKASEEVCANWLGPLGRSLRGWKPVIARFRGGFPPYATIYLLEQYILSIKSHLKLPPFVLISASSHRMKVHVFSLSLCEKPSVFVPRVILESRVLNTQHYHIHNLYLFSTSVKLTHLIVLDTCT